MRIVVAGSGGFVGRWLVPELESRGHTVVRLVRRREAAESPGRPLWDPSSGDLDPELLEGVDAVVNLAGRNVANHRWTPREKGLLETSRLDATQTLVKAMERSSRPPRIFLNASATGYYGSRDDEELDESASPGEGFLAGLTRSWEEAAIDAAAAGVRVVTLRLGMVLGRGGALSRMLPAFRLGLGGPLGAGRQWWPWIAMEDVLGAIGHLLEHPEVSGPVNLVSPCPVRCRDFARTLGRVLGRPAVLPIPAPALRLLLGPMANELLLSSQRVVPGVLESTGYVFRLPDLAATLRAAMD